MQNRTEAEKRIQDGKRCAYIIWRIFFICLGICLLPLPVWVQVCSGILVFSVVICSGPLLILTFGGCGCGHPACSVCNYRK